MNFKMKCYSQAGKCEELSLDVSKDVTLVSRTVFSLVARVFINRARQATSSSKTRGEVNFSRKKMWKQKGTGRARCGAAGSPLWRHGGVIFGPTPGCRRLSINRKVAKSSLGSVIAKRLFDNEVAVMDYGFSDFEKKLTSRTDSFIKKIGFEGKKIGLILDSDDWINCKAFCNIPTVNVLFFDQLNIKNLSSGSCLFFLKKDLNRFREVVGQWI